MRQMDESLMGRQHDSMAHRISYKPYRFSWSHVWGWTVTFLGCAAVWAVLILALVGFGD